MKMDTKPDDILAEERIINCDDTAGIENEDKDSPEDPDVSSDEQSRLWTVDEDYLKENDKELTDEEKQSRKLAADKLKSDGNESFQSGNYEEAAKSYTLALNTCPISFTEDRAVLYANRAACFLYMEKHKDGIADCSKSLEMNPNYLKAILRRAVLYEKSDKLDEALEDYKKVLEMDPRNPKALEACMRLPAVINERNEKLKTEMMSKLKDLGNMVLRPFGLSTENFNVQKIPTQDRIPSTSSKINEVNKMLKIIRIRRQ